MREIKKEVDNGDDVEKEVPTGASCERV